MQLSSAFADDILCSSGGIGIRGRFKLCFSPGSTPGWSTKNLKAVSGDDFVNNVSAVAIGMLIAAHREGDEEKFKAYVELIAETYEQQENDHAANIIRSYYTGDYGEQGKAVLDEATEQTTYKDTNANSIAAGKCKFVAKNSGILFV